VIIFLTFMLMSPCKIHSIDKSTSILDIESSIKSPV